VLRTLGRRDRYPGKARRVFAVVDGDLRGRRELHQVSPAQLADVGRLPDLDARLPERIGDPGGVEQRVPDLMAQLGVVCEPFENVLGNDAAMHVDSSLCGWVWQILSATV